MTLTVHKFIQDADSTNFQYLSGDDFEAILDVLEDSGEVEEQCAVIVRNVS